MISAIIVCHNGGQVLERCLASLERAGQKLEVVAVDNASSDGSGKLVERYFPGAAVLYRASNVGFGAAVNQAAERAQGDTLLLLNQDAWLQEGALERLTERLDAGGRIGLVAPQLRYPDGDLQLTWSPARSLVGEAMQRFFNGRESSAWVHGGPAKGLARLAGPVWYTAACLLLRTEAFRAVRGFDERFFLYFEDVDLCLRLEAAGWRLVQDPAAAVTHAGGLRGRDVPDDLYRPSQLLFYRLHRPAWECRALERRLRRRFGNTTVDQWLVAVGEEA